MLVYLYTYRLLTTPECSEAEKCCFAEDFMRRDSRRNYAVGIQHIREALIACGYAKLDQQAKALGIHRATAWTIVNKKHKIDRLSIKTIRRILENPELPHPVRAVVEQYVAERSDAFAKRLRGRPQ